MRILIAIPALNLEANDIGQAVNWIANEGHQVVCLAAKSNPSKSIRTSPSVSVRGNLTILRPWMTYGFASDLPEAAALLARKALMGSTFDVILCCQDFNLPFIRWLRALSSDKLPVAVLYEQAWRSVTSETTSARTRLAHMARGLSQGAAFFGWVAKHADALITCDPADLGHLDELRSWNPRFEYVPWCTDPGWRRTRPPQEPVSAVFAGALAGNKNPHELLAVALQVLEGTHTAKFRLVTSQDATPALAEWHRQLGVSLETHVNCSLVETAMLIEKSTYGVSAAARGGWGFIGNCWAMGTPLVMLHPNSFVQSRHAILPAWEYPKPNDAVTALLSDENLQRKIRDSGYSIFRENHSAEVVGRRLLEVLESIAQ